MNRFVMAIGLPFSGKSELAREYEVRGWKIIERDRILDAIINSEEFKNRVAALKDQHPNLTSEEVFEIKNDLAIEMLGQEVARIVTEAKGQDVFYDGTNLQRKSRESILKKLPKEMEKSAIYLKVPIEEIINRMVAVYSRGEREGKFNRKALGSFRKMLHLLEEPDPAEGFKEIEVREFGKPEIAREFRGMGK